MDKTSQLPVAVRTEDGQVLSRPTAKALSALLQRIGGPGDHFVVVERIPDEEHVFIQAWRNGTGPFEVESRDGSPDGHHGICITDPAAAGAVFTAWARQAAGWRSGLDWQPVDLVSVPEVSAERRREAEEYAQRLIDSGFQSFNEIVVSLTEYFGDDESLTSVQAGRILTAPWNRRLAEQADWPRPTDPERIATAFSGLEQRGITAKMNFTCCQNCGVSEIGAHAADGARGYTFFHQQDTERAAEGGSLWLAYGTFPDSPDPATGIGHEVTAALKAAGLMDWNGSPGQRIRLSGLDWRNRLPI